VDILWWFLVAVGNIAVSYLLGTYIEKNLERPHITAELTALVVFLLWVAIIVGIVLDRTVLR
jgi:uncharacterized BrkB/YihY/UPF0761 family membrane protein